MLTSLNVLITSVSKKIPLIKAVRKSLEIFNSNALNFKSKVFGGDCNFHCAGRYFVDGFWHMPYQDILSIEEVISYCKQHDIKAIIPTRDGELPFFAKHKDNLSRHGIACLVSTPQAIDFCLNKLLFYQFLSLNHLPAIPTSKTIDAIHSSSYVVKECFGAGSRSLGKDLTYPMAKQWAEKLKHPIYQPYIRGIEYSVDVYIDRHGIPLGSIARERESIEEGESQITASVKLPDVEAMCLKIASLLNIYGPAVFQVLYDQSKHLHIIECNPRFGGASTLSVAMGLKIFDWFFQETLQLPLSPFVRSPQEMRQVRYAEDLVNPI